MTIFYNYIVFLATTRIYATLEMEYWNGILKRLPFMSHATVFTIMILRHLVKFMYAYYSIMNSVVKQ